MFELGQIFSDFFQADIKKEARKATMQALKGPQVVKEQNAGKDILKALKNREEAMKKLFFTPNSGDNAIAQNHVEEDNNFATNMINKVWEKSVHKIRILDEYQDDILVQMMLAKSHYIIDLDISKLKEHLDGEKDLHQISPINVVCENKVHTNKEDRSQFLTKRYKLVVTQACNFNTGEYYLLAQQRGNDKVIKIKLPMQISEQRLLNFLSVILQTSKTWDIVVQTPKPEQAY